MNKRLLISFLLFGLIQVCISSCNNKQQVDLIIFNGKIITVDDKMTVANAMIINNGKIVNIGSIDLLNKYTSDSIIDLNGQCVYPGFNDAHGHFYGLGLTTQQVDLVGTKSWDEVIARCKKFAANHPHTIISGRGWDQNDWTIKEYPTNEKLNQLFTDVPVLLKRIDGHAAIANDYALKLASLNETSNISGGELLVKANKLTGVLIDNAVDLVQDKLPQSSTTEKIQTLLNAQSLCFSYGLTSVCDAGLDNSIIHLIDSLQQKLTLPIRLYIMVNATSNNLDYWLTKTPIKTTNLNVSSFKMYADGALGSRGACMLIPYNDQPNHFGFLLCSFDSMETTVKRIANSPYQLNTHCIGDSANRLVLKLYADYLSPKNNRRWRIEHAQVIDSNDFHFFGEFGIIPSVQPVHATSDMYWATQRIGADRMKGAYALNTLLKQNGWLPLGTDFPVESPNPFHTFYAAVARKDANNFPKDGFQMDDALTREQALKGITIWPAQAAFEENIKGSLEENKLADFVITDSDLLNDPLDKIRKTKVNRVFVGGKLVYARKN